MTASRHLVYGQLESAEQDDDDDSFHDSECTTVSTISSDSDLAEDMSSDGCGDVQRHARRYGAPGENFGQSHLHGMKRPVFKHLKQNDPSSNT